MMKALLILLATTSFTYAASVGVSEDQLRGSGIKGSATHEDKAPSPPPAQWELTGSYIINDGTEEGVDVSLPLAAYPTKEQCEAVASDLGNVKAALEHHGMKLDCRLPK